MNYGAFTNDSLTTMYEVVRGALDADDTLKARGEEIRFRVRETAEWKKHAADLEMEMIKRGRDRRGRAARRYLGQKGLRHRYRQSLTTQTKGEKSCRSCFGSSEFRFR